MSEKVCKDCGTAIHPRRFKCWPCWQKQTGREIPEYAKAEAELHERRLPSSQPEKVEPRVGQTWKYKTKLVEVDWVIAHVDYVHKRVRDAFNKWDLDFDFLRSMCTLVECPSTLISTGEAEKPAVPKPATKRAKVCFSCGTEGDHPERVFGSGRARCWMCDYCYQRGEAIPMMDAHNDAFHEKQKAAILANYEAQKREPAYQPHWQRTGVQTYSRRVPK